MYMYIGSWTFSATRCWAWSTRRTPGRFAVARKAGGTIRLETAIEHKFLSSSCSSLSSGRFVVTACGEAISYVQVCPLNGKGLYPLSKTSF